MKHSNEPTRAMLIPLTSDADESGVTTIDIVNGIRRRWFLFAVAAVVSIAAAVLIYITADVKYRASTTVIVASHAQGSANLGSIGTQLGGLASLAGISLPNSSGLREESFAVLESRKLLRDFIVAEELIPLLYADQWNSVDEVWETDSGQAPSVEQAVRFFRDNVLSINREPGGNIVELSITWTDPKLCALWSAALVNRTNNSLRQRARDEAQESIKFLEQELDSSSNTQLQGAVFALIEQNMATIMMANVRPDFAFRIIDPAAVPESDRPVWPRASYILVAAVCVWLLFSSLAALTFAFRDRTTTSN